MKRCRDLHKDVRCVQVKVDVSISKLKFLASDLQVFRVSNVNRNMADHENWCFCGKCTHSCSTTVVSVFIPVAPLFCDFQQLFLHEARLRLCDFISFVFAEFIFTCCDFHFLSLSFSCPFLPTPVFNLFISLYLFRSVFFPLSVHLFASWHWFASLPLFQIFTSATFWCVLSLALQTSWIFIIIIYIMT